MNKVSGYCFLFMWNCEYVLLNEYQLSLKTSTQRLLTYQIKKTLLRGGTFEIKYRYLILQDW